MESMLTPIKRAETKACDMWKKKKIQMSKQEIIESITRCYQEITSHSDLNTNITVIRAAHGARTE